MALGLDTAGLFWMNAKLDAGCLSTAWKIGKVVIRLVSDACSPRKLSWHSAVSRSTSPGGK